MDIAGMLQQTGALDSIARQLGIDAGAAQAGAGALMPAIAGGFKKQAQAGSGGLGDLAGMLGGLGGGALLDEVTASGPTPSEPGNRILGQIFGSKDVSRTVASQAAQTSGVDPSILKKMLPLLAMAAAGYMTRQGGGARRAGWAGRPGARRPRERAGRRVGCGHRRAGLDAGSRRRRQSAGRHSRHGRQDRLNPGASAARVPQRDRHHAARFEEWE